MMCPAERQQKQQRLATGQRRGRDRSPSRDTPRSVIPFPRRGSPPRDEFSSTVNNTATDSINVPQTGVSSRRCYCKNCYFDSDLPQEKDRDWSIRFPGMTREQFDEMMIVLDDPELMSVGDNCWMRDDSVPYSPVEMPDFVPASPQKFSTHSMLAMILQLLENKRQKYSRRV